MSILRFAFIGTLTLALAAPAAAAETATPPAELLAQASQEAKHAFLLFWKKDDEATQKLAEELAAGLEAHAAQATMIEACANDEANQPLVEKYNLSRAPMPMVLVLAPNGAVTGHFTLGKISAAQIKSSIVTPTMSRVMQALQKDKLVLITIAKKGSPKPEGAAEFLADPEFKARTVLVSLPLGDPKEARFYRDLKIEPGDEESKVAFLAPPGVMIGRFNGDVTKEVLAQKLHAAGKCCDDENCKHNKPGAK